MRWVLIAVAGKKPHRFDLATREHDIVGECKAFTWTEGGNIPSAKISTLKEAVSYLGTLPGQTRRSRPLPTAPILPAANARRPACDSRFRLIFRLLLQCGARGSDGARVGSEREAFNARQGNGRSTLGNPLKHAIHEACCGA